MMYSPGQSLSVVSRMDVQLNSKSSHKSSPLTVGAPLNVGAPLSVGSPLQVGSHLCEDGRAYVTDPVTGRQICMCSLGAGAEAHFPHVNMSHEARKQGALSASGGPHCMGFDTSAFCSPVLRGLPMRPERIPPYLTAGLPGHSMAFDPALAAHPYGLLYPGMDMNGPMRKAATRETTGPLKAWLNEHKKNPYPTKAEKIMLAIITRMTLTQVSTWFANARRRLKKDNKLYPGDRRAEDDYDDDDDDLDSQKDGSGPHRSGSDKMNGANSDNEDINVDDSDDTGDDADLLLDKNSVRGFGASFLYPQGPGHSWSSSGSDVSPLEETSISRDVPSNSVMRNGSSDSGSTPQTESSSQSKTGSAPKPKIWSISEIIGTATETPASVPGPVHGSRLMPQLIIPNPFLPSHLSSLHMNQSAMMSSFSSSLTSSHRFHHQLTTMPGLFLPMHDPLSSAASSSSSSAAEHYKHQRHYNNISPAGSRSPANNRMTPSPEKDISDTTRGHEHSKTVKGDNSESHEASEVKLEDNAMSKDLAGNYISRAGNSERLSPHSHSTRNKMIAHHSPPHTSNLNSTRTSLHVTTDRKDVTSVTNRIVTSAQKETALYSERPGHGDLALNLHKALEN